MIYFKKPVALAFLFMCTALGLVEAQQPAGTSRRGDEYFLALGKMFSRHNFDHAQILHQYAALSEPIPDDVLNEHIREMRSDLTSAKAAYGKLSEKAKTDPMSGKKIVELQTHLKQIDVAIDQMEHAVGELQDADSKLVMDLTKDVTTSAKSSHAAAQAIHFYFNPNDATPHFDQGVFAN